MARAPRRTPPARRRPAGCRLRARVPGRSRIPIQDGHAGGIRRRARGRDDRVHLRRRALRRRRARCLAARGRPPPARGAMSAPGWALDLVAEVCADAGARAPLLSWRTRRGEASTGLARRADGLVAIRAGSDPLDQRLTLLHELAHWLTPAGRRRGRSVHHGRAFYAIAFDLYRRFGLSAADAL